MTLPDLSQLSAKLRVALQEFEKGNFAEASRQTKIFIADVTVGKNASIEENIYSLRLIDIYLRSSEFSVSGTKNNEVSHWDSVAQKGVEIAQKTGSKVWLGRMMGLQGKIMRATQGYKSAITTMSNALEILESIDDTVGKFIVMSELGHLIIHEDLKKGVDQLYFAHKLYLSAIDGRRFDDPDILIRRTLYRLEGFIGIGELDLNHFGNAHPFIERSIAGLRGLGMTLDLVRMLNFRAQLAMSTGAFEVAERTIKDLLERHEHEDLSAWQVYNRSMLGKLYLEWGRIPEAQSHLEQAYEEMLSFTNADLTPLVNNYYCELLINHSGEEHDHVKAREILAETLSRCSDWGAIRGIIVAQYLLACVSFKLGQGEDTLQHIQSAVNLIAEYGILPVVRVEEIYFYHYKFLKDSGALDYRTSLEMAFEILMNKADSVQDSDKKQQMLNRIPINQSIIRAYREETR